MEPPTTPPGPSGPNEGPVGPYGGQPGPYQGPPYGAPQSPGYPTPPGGGYPPNQGYPPPGGGDPSGGYPPGPGYPPPGQGYPPPGYPPFPGQNYVPPRKTNVLAVVTFVVGLLGMIPVSVVLGIVALVQISKSNDKGKGFAFAGLGLAALWVAGLVTVGILAAPSEPDRDASGQVTTTQNARPDKLRVGDCVTEVKEGEVNNIKVQPCSQPNGGKVFAVFDLPAGKWPGLTEVQTAAEKGCTDRYDASNEQAETPSDIFYLHPTQDSWSLGDRGTVCLLTPR